MLSELVLVTGTHKYFLKVLLSIADLKIILEKCLNTETIKLDTD